MEPSPPIDDLPVHLRRSAMKWLQKDFKVVTSDVALGPLLKLECQFLVVQKAGGDFLTVAMRSTLNDVFTALALSRFPGDLPPEQMPLSQLLQWRPLDDFYIVNESFSTSRPELWLNDLPARHVLILREGLPVAVVAKEDFNSWLESLRRCAPMTITFPTTELNG